MSRFQPVGRGNEWEECMPIILGPNGELAHNIPAHAERTSSGGRGHIWLQGSLGNTRSWVISNQLLWEKLERASVDNQTSLPHLCSIVSILDLIQLLENLTNHRRKTRYKSVNLPGYLSLTLSHRAIYILMTRAWISPHLSHSSNHLLTQNYSCSPSYFRTFVYFSVLIFR